MKKTLTLLLATSALSATFALPAWSAMRAPTEGSTSQLFAALFDDAPQALPFLLVSDHDDDDDEDDDDDDCGDDDDDCRGARNPAPAGTVTPPQNGLFGNGAPPQVQMN